MDILSYKPTPQGKQIGYITVKFEQFILNFCVQKGKEGGVFFTSPAFKESENGPWIKGHELDSKSAQKILDTRFSSIIKRFPAGYDREIHGDDRGVALQSKDQIEATKEALGWEKPYIPSKGTNQQQNSTNSPQTGLPPIDDEPPF